MNILGIDFGTKNIGLAWSDTDIGVVLPFGVVHSVADVIKVIKEEKIDKVVLGLPVSLDGKEQSNAERVRKFAQNLKKEMKIPLEFYDERFSSQQADAMGGVASRDEKSAMVILNSFLERKNN